MARERCPKERRSSGANHVALGSVCGVFFLVIWPCPSKKPCPLFPQAIRFPQGAVGVAPWARAMQIRFASGDGDVHADVHIASQANHRPAESAVMYGCEALAARALSAQPLT